MDAKPKYLGRQFGDVFHDQSVAERYHLRPPYPPETFHVLAGLLAAEPRAVLDVGAGRGDIARELLPYASRVDALDPSAAMIALGQALPGGDDPRLRWIKGYAEDAPLDPPYALITAGASLHWMDWPLVLPRFKSVLAPHGSLAVLTTVDTPVPWHDALLPIIQRYSMNTEYVPYDLIAHLESVGLFARAGEIRTTPVRFEQRVDDYVEAFHSMSSFSRERMPAENAAAFDAALRALASAHAHAGRVSWEVSALITWGKPLDGR
ncbi:MAG: class I SAM-dependent methyltransferase [Ktedonobacterales bacterium]